MLTFIFFLTTILVNCYFFKLKQWFLLPFVFVLSLMMAFLITFLFLVFCLAIMSFFPPNHSFKGFVIRSLSRCIKTFLRIEVTVKNKNLFPLKENIIIYANHKSYIDAFLIASELPRTLAFAPKDKFCFPVLTKWFLDLAFYSSDCMVVSRDNIRKTSQNLINIIPKIKLGLALVVFPEGGMTNVNDEKVTSLLRGSFKISFKSEASIIPLTVKGASQIKNYFWWQKKKVEIIIHKSLKYNDYRGQTTQQIALNVEKIINSSFE